MASPLLDFKKFKHIKSDDKHTVLKHQDGHELTILHKALSPANQKALSALSKLPAQTQTADQAQEAQVDNPRLADGGSVSRSTQRRLDVQNEAQNPKITESKKTPPENVLDYNKLREEKRRMNVAEANKPKLAKGGTIPDPNPATAPMVLAKMAEGGDTTPEQDEARQDQEKAAGEAYDKLHGQTPQSQQEPTLDPRTWWARGGEARKMYASPDQPVSKSDDTPTNEVVPSPDEVMTPNPNYVPPKPLDQRPAPQDPMLQHQRDLYNAAVDDQMFSGMDPGSPNPGVRELAASQKIGPDGKPPREVNVAAAKAAQQQIEREASEKLYASQAAQKEAGAKNDALQQLGYAPTAVDSSLPSTAPVGMQPNDGLGQPPVQPDPFQRSVDMLQAGYEAEKAGIGQKAEAEAALGQAQVPVYQQNIDAQALAQKHYERAFQDLQSEFQGVVKDINNTHISPENYWKDHSKLAAGIGLLLGGFNATSRPNAAQEFLQHQMDNNLRAQVEDLGRKKTMLGAYLQQFGNIKDALDMTRLTQAAITQNAILKSAAKMAGPNAKANAQIAVGQLQQRYAPLQQQFAMRQAVMNAAQDGSSPDATNRLLAYYRMTEPEKAKEMESRIVPGIGMSKTTPVPDNVRQQLVAHKTVMDTMGQVLQFAKKNAGSMNPTVRAQGQTLIDQLQSQIRTAEDQGVYKKSEADFLSDMIGDNPAGFLANFNTVPKVKELQKLQLVKYNNLLKTYGLPQTTAPASQQTPQAAAAWAKANPTDPRAKKILSLIGR